ncbi:MAG: aconitate hydratase [Elusimicrobia bacterium]|nr:aconitate hydratase [Elusimicrobiota bacterium]MBD3411855.1 aconitate hydratase [Elusimicrobiota bacterium]
MPTLSEKIIRKHLVSGTMRPGSEIGLRIDQTLTQDATGTLAYLQFETLGLPKVRTKCSVSYVDHNMLQTGFENADDHRYLQTVAARYGIYFSRPGNGICHQVHLERFGVPGETLLGSDSHTPTAGGLGMIGIGAGGLDVAVAMAGEPFYVTMPRITNVQLLGKLQPYVNAKDVILEILGRLSVKGGIGCIFEYTGEGLRSLSVPERATITNMGAELGATTSVFPSDQMTRLFLRALGREKYWKPLTPDADAVYADTVRLDLSKIVPMAARPHMPDNVVPVSRIAGLPVQQVCIGSCTNSSLKDLLTVSAILKDRTVHPGVSLIVAPGSRSVLTTAIRLHALEAIINAGGRIAESACGFCIGMGHAPGTDAVSLRTINRNFEARSGTKSARVYLVSPEVAAWSAVKGFLADPRKSGRSVDFKLPKHYVQDDNGIIKPSQSRTRTKVLRGPNIKPLPLGRPIQESLTGTVLLKLPDNITTDHIMPAGAKILPLRSNIPAMATHAFAGIDPTFPERARSVECGIIVAGHNYGQGSSREHAALVPMYLNIKAVVAQSFSRIHRKNLINFGIIPLLFDDPADYTTINAGDTLIIKAVYTLLSSGYSADARTTDSGITISVHSDCTDREARIVRAGGLLNDVRKRRTHMKREKKAVS